MSEKLLEDIREQYEREMPLSHSAIEWLIEQSEKSFKYKKALNTLLTSNHWQNVKEVEDFIKDALSGK